MLTIALAARAAWIVVLLGGVALLSRQPPRPRAAASLMAGGSCAALVVVVSATGGTQSGYFGFLLALPFCMLVLLPGQLAPAVTCGGVGIAAGALMLSGAGAPAVEIARWTGTGLAASALAAYATHVGGSLIQRMLQAASARAETLAALAESERRRAASDAPGCDTCAAASAASASAAVRT